MRRFTVEGVVVEVPEEFVSDPAAIGYAQNMALLMHEWGQSGTYVVAYVPGSGYHLRKVPHE